MVRPSYLHVGRFFAHDAQKTGARKDDGLHKGKKVEPLFQNESRKTILRTYPTLTGVGFKFPGMRFRLKSLDLGFGFDSSPFEDSGVRSRV